MNNKVVNQKTKEWKMIKAPGGIPEQPGSHNLLKLKGLTILETCIMTSGIEGKLYLEEHLLLFVVQGSYRIRYGQQHKVIRKKEMMLIEKARVIEYFKSGEAEGEMLDYWMFFLGDELLAEFAKMTDLKGVHSAETPERGSEPAGIRSYPISERLFKYLESVKPYFTEKESVPEGLIKLKLMELLFGIAAADGQLLRQLTTMSRPDPLMDLKSVMENHITVPLSIPELAHLSGRSLSGFKRDFHALYNMAPSRWLREQRVRKAKELLESTSYSVTDIGLMTGFESPAHFSRVFKEVEGIAPSAYRQHQLHPLKV